MRRVVLALMVVVGLVAAAPGAGAEPSVSERIAQHRQEVLAKIECHRAEIRGEPCGAQQRSAPAPAPQPVAQPAPRSEPQASGPSSPAGPGEKVIEIIISSQRLRAWEGDRLVLDTPVSTGKPGHETPTGRFSILSKEENHWSTQYHVWMPWAMRVVRGIFIHELPVTTDGRRLGEADLGTPVSAGCIRVGVGTAHDLYHWTPIGTPVIIR